MTALIQILGGIGVFLLGMVIMTEGLKNLAGAQLNNFLIKATHNPLSGAITGTTSTAILQSSSATTVAAVGFVSAGLLTFPQALGIIFGANLGTTITGWMVALLGFKLKLGSILLPVIFFGIMMRLFGRGTLAAIGYALAGFGLVFVGIDLLQQAAGNFQWIRPDILQTDGFISRLQLVFIGIIATVITQSSSAGVAVTLVAINAGLIQFEQAAALIIGMDVGTTVTAAMATIGGSVGTRRTGFSHVIYNAFTAIGAFILISPFVLLWESISELPVTANAEIALVAFHSSFNLVGVIVVLPFANQFAKFMETIIPEKAGHRLKSLDPTLLKEPSIAMVAVAKIVENQFLALMTSINQILKRESTHIRTDLNELQKVLDETHGYLDLIHIRNSEGREFQQLIALFHALDHMQRLHERCDEDLERALTASSNTALRQVEKILESNIDRVIAEVSSDNWQTAVTISTENFEEIKLLVQPQREKIYHLVARGNLTVPESTDCAEALRWMSRVSHHLARICFYLHKYNNGHG